MIFFSDFGLRESPFESALIETTETVSCKHSKRSFAQPNLLDDVASFSLKNILHENHTIRQSLEIQISATTIFNNGSNHIFLLLDA